MSDCKPDCACWDCFQESKVEPSYGPPRVAVLKSELEALQSLQRKYDKAKARVVLLEFWASMLLGELRDDDTLGWTDGWISVQKLSDLLVHLPAAPQEADDA